MADLAETLDVVTSLPFDRTEAVLRLVPAAVDPAPAAEPPHLRDDVPADEAEYVPMYYI
jgi:hypothetical protein